MTSAGNLPGVLLVEADMLIRTPLADYLRECGYRVLEARSADEARSLLGSVPEAIDMVLADARGAPDDTGFALAHWLRERYPDVDVILTGAVEDLTRKAATICEDGPAPGPRYDHRRVLDRIRQTTAARQRRRAG